MDPYRRIRRKTDRARRQYRKRDEYGGRQPFAILSITRSLPARRKRGEPGRAGRRQRSARRARALDRPERSLRRAGAKPARGAARVAVDRARLAGRTRAALRRDAAARPRALPRERRPFLAARAAGGLSRGSSPVRPAL